MTIVCNCIVRQDSKITLSGNNTRDRVQKFPASDGHLLPRSCLRKRVRFEKDTCPPDSVGLLLFKMLHGGEILKNHEEVLARDSTYEDLG
jgi:hypothetical protein